MQRQAIFERVTFVALVLLFGVASGACFWVVQNMVGPQPAPADASADAVPARATEHVEVVEKPAIPPATSVRFERAPSVLAGSRYFFAKMTESDLRVLSYDPITLEKSEVTILPVPEDSDLAEDLELLAQLRQEGIPTDDLAAREVGKDAVADLEAFGYGVEGTTVADVPILDYVVAADERRIFLLTTGDIREFNVDLNIVRILTKLPHSTFTWSGLEDGDDGHLRLTGTFEEDSWFIGGGSQHFFVDKLAGHMYAMTPIIARRHGLELLGVKN